MPKAIDPTVAQTNITKFNKSVINSALIDCANATSGHHQTPKVFQETPRRVAVIVSENSAALTLKSIDQ